MDKLSNFLPAAQAARILMRCLFLTLFILFNHPIFAQCNPDVTAPSVSCDQFYGTQINLDGPGMTVVQAHLLDEGSTDNCTPQANLEFRASFNASSTPPPETELSFTSAGVFQVYFWAIDEAGNWNSCAKFVWVDNPQCAPDNTPPTVVAPPDMTMTTDAFEALNIDFFNPVQSQIDAAFGAAYHWDNCSNGNSNYAESYYLWQYPVDLSARRLQRRFFVTDDAGNLAEGIQFVNVYPTYTMHVPAWRLPGDPAPEAMSASGNTLGVTVEHEYSTAVCDGSLSRDLRTWTVVDSNLLTLQPQAFVLPQLDIDNDGMTGDAYDVIALADSIWLYQNGVPTLALAKRTARYVYEQELRYNYRDTSSYLVSGTVFLDADADCLKNAGESGLSDWKVKGIGIPSQRIYYAETQANGLYALFVCNDDTGVELSLDVPYNYSGVCPALFNRTFGTANVIAQNFAVQLNSVCQLMDVNITTPSMRPCFEGQYSVHYCNYHANTVSGTYIDVTLDPDIAFAGSSMPATPQGNNVYRFLTGDLPPGFCGDFQIEYLLECDAPVGAAYCSEAHLYPEDPCGWNGPIMKASAVCNGSEVNLKVENIGSAAMSAPADFVVAEDLLMLMSVPVQLGIGESHIITQPANGATWRIEIPQSAGYPWGLIAAAAIEGCGGINQPGLLNQLPINLPNPFISLDCTESTASLDPNDKQGFPRGTGAQHDIKPNTDIEYMIRFQNTGTDTAFTVVILDTLSDKLDARSLRPGASSHDYDMDLLGDHILRFRFDGILLPDSNTNEAASHGFVKFRIRQQPDNPAGSLIYNSAAIYFDFNAPVITNTTLHTVRNEVLLVQTKDLNGISSPLQISPNPASDEVLITMPESRPGNRFTLFNAAGMVEAERRFDGRNLRFQRGNLPAGLYFFRISDDRGALYEGKLMFK